MPYSHSLEGWLRFLDLRGTSDLHIFNSHLSEGARLKGQAFFLLSEVSFNYHAHCCQLKRSNYSYLEPNFDPPGKKREISSQWHIFQRLYDYFLSGAILSSQHPGIAFDDQLRVKHRNERQTIPDENAMANALTCLNYTDFNIVLFPDSDIISEGGIGEMDNSTDLPEGWFFHPNTTDLICTENEIVNIVTQVYRPCPNKNPSPSHTVSAVPDISPTPSTTLQTDTITSLSTMATAIRTTPVLAASVTPAACSSGIVEVFCILTAAATTTMAPPTTVPPLPSCDCDMDGDYDLQSHLCIFCTDIGCEDDLCDDYQYICNGNCSPGKRRRKYTTAVKEGACMFGPIDFLLI